MSWDEHKVLSSTRRGSAKDTRSKLAELESSKYEAINELLSKYPKADLSKITASKDEFGRTMVYLLRKGIAAKFPLLDDSTLGKSDKGAALGTTLEVALGDKAEKFLEDNDEVMQSLDEKKLWKKIKSMIKHTKRMLIYN